MYSVALSTYTDTQRYHFESHLLGLRGTQNGHFHQYLNTKIVTKTILSLYTMGQGNKVKRVEASETLQTMNNIQYSKK